MDSWSNERLMSYEIAETSFPLQVGVNQYTIGTGGTINTTRPDDILQAYVQDTGNNNYGLRIVPRDKWNQIGNRGSTITSQIPNTLFYDPQYPLGVINIFPYPLVAYTVFLDMSLQQSQFSGLTTALSLPPGYEMAIVLNLAVNLSNVSGIPVPPPSPGGKSLFMRADEAKGNIKRTNLPEIIADYDNAIVSHANATYNIYSDSDTSRG